MFPLGPRPVGCPPRGHHRVSAGTRRHRVDGPQRRIGVFEEPLPVEVELGERQPIGAPGDGERSGQLPLLVPEVGHAVP